MIESLTSTLILGVALVVILVCWLIYISRGNRPIKLNIEGLGIKVNIDASSAPIQQENP